MLRHLKHTLTGPLLFASACFAAGLVVSCANDAAPARAKSIDVKSDFGAHIRGIAFAVSPEKDGKVTSETGPVVDFWNAVANSGRPVMDDQAKEMMSLFSNYISFPGVLSEQLTFKQNAAKAAFGFMMYHAVFSSRARINDLPGMRTAAEKMGENLGKITELRVGNNNVFPVLSRFVKLVSGADGGKNYIATELAEKGANLSAVTMTDLKEKFAYAAKVDGKDEALHLLLKNLYAPYLVYLDGMFEAFEIKNDKQTSTKSAAALLSFYKGALFLEGTTARDMVQKSIFEQKYLSVGNKLTTGLRHFHTRWVKVFQLAKLKPEDVSENVKQVFETAFTTAKQRACTDVKSGEEKSTQNKDKLHTPFAEMIYEKFSYSIPSVEESPANLRAMCAAVFPDGRCTSPCAAASTSKEPASSEGSEPAQQTE